MKAIETVTADQNCHCPDLGGKATTRRVTDAVIAALKVDSTSFTPSSLSYAFPNELAAIGV